MPDGGVDSGSDVAAGAEETDMKGKKGREGKRQSMSNRKTNLCNDM